MKVSGASYRVYVPGIALLMCGCFSYVPVALDTVPPGENVRIFLSPEELAELRKMDEAGLPESGPPLVRGTVVRRDEGGIAIRIPIATHDVGFLRAPIARQVSIRSSEVVQIERRHFDQARTGIAVAGTAALVGTMAYFILNDAQNAQQRPETPSDAAARIPVFAFSFR